ncbi:PLP-dependent cysteine synthase family protein [Pseudoalteromonas luteoviolacea]|uniref:PLP-dependent cysteine synthase family protein n=1 Tax=Pseudoalteromonas luteoviolacea TaxID=43657 RepID=UPI0007B09302|nr:PLP-dependent cysteine synthase family protein [Pseudoalteromonas luteoviolacea]KZN56178.1 hypothetical protein N474_12925 [Pseudoalteromonas luteoviolacea CPMOR-2]TQF66777.1 PLP-dependent cysteine synthase family protein [Pseudoalteromonas luteoviolacea]
MKSWVKQSIAKIEADQNRSADTHLFKFQIPQFNDIYLYLKDESTHPTGSLKHRLARSLFLYALCNGKIKEGTPVIEASSGSTAVSEAYFAQMIGVPFVAVMPASTAQSKIDQIQFYGGQCHFVECATDMHDTAVELAEKLDGYFMDQFMYAERATDWRGNNNIAESIFNQMKYEPHPVPDLVVMGAGTGGTSATLGRYILYKGYATELMVVDPEFSAFYEGYTQKSDAICTGRSSRIEGIGRPKVEKSFQPDVIDHMMQVPDAASIAAMLWLEEFTGRKAGPSTGTNLWGALCAAESMKNNNKGGAIVTLICDSGNRYLDTYYNPEWVETHIGDITPYQAKLNEWFSV